jgi:hypothetical protein
MQKRSIFGVYTFKLLLRKCPVLLDEGECPSREFHTVGVAKSNYQLFII